MLQHIKHAPLVGSKKNHSQLKDKRAPRKEGSSSIRPETTHVMSAIKTAIPIIGLFSHKRRCDTTQPEINKMENKNIRIYHPWSSLTDRGLNERDLGRVPSIVSSHIARCKGFHNNYQFGLLGSCLLRKYMASVFNIIKKKSACC